MKHISLPKSCIGLLLITCARRNIMKAKTLSTAIAFTGLLTVGGTTFAADPHDAYHRAFPGDGGTWNSMQQQEETMGKAAYGTPTSSTPTWSGHDAYHRAFPGDGGMPNGISDTASMGKAAFGSSSSSDNSSAIDGNAAYHRAFRGD